MPLRTLPLIAGWLIVLIGTVPSRAYCAANQSPEIGVLLRFDTTPGRVFVSTMERELARIMDPVNLRLRWLLPDNSDGTQNFSRAVVFTFHGECRAVSGRPEQPAQIGRIALADTWTEGAVILPYSETDCDHLRGFLSKEEPSSVGAESRMGFAMARVLAHELYHFLLQTRAHGDRGISREVHTPSALLSRSLRFQPAEVKRMRARFAVKPAPPDPRVRPVSVAPVQQLSFKPN